MSLLTSWFHSDSHCTFTTNTNKYFKNSTEFRICCHVCLALCQRHSFWRRSTEIWIIGNSIFNKRVLCLYLVWKWEICNLCFCGKQNINIYLHIWNLWFPGSQKWDRYVLFFFLHSWHFLEFRFGSLLRYSSSSPPFPHKCSGGHANHFQGFLYFSFLPVKQRDFPGNVRLGGCDSLPLVVAFTSKQHDSPLSYALHFLHIISHQMCCAGERAECCAHQSVEKSLHTSLRKMQEKQELSQRSGSGCQGQQQVCFFPPSNWNKKRRKTKCPDKPTLHLSLEHERISLWYAVYFRRRLGPTVTCWNPSAALNLTRCLTLKT